MSAPLSAETSQSYGPDFAVFARAQLGRLREGKTVVDPLPVERMFVDIASLSGAEAGSYAHAAFCLESREWLALSVLTRLFNSPSREMALLERLLAVDSGAFVRVFRRRIDYRSAWRPQPELLVPQILAGLQNPAHPAVLPLIVLLDDMAPCCPAIHAILAAHPEAILDIEMRQLVKLLPLLDADTLRRLLPLLARRLTASGAKTLRVCLVGLSARIEPVDLRATGWLESSSRYLLQTCGDILLAHPDPAAHPLLAELLASGRLDVALASRVEAHLQTAGGAGERARAAAEPSLASLEADAATLKRIAAAVGRYETPELLALFAPLSVHAARVLLHLVATSEDELPPLAVRLLAQVPAANRADLELLLVKGWIGLGGDPRDAWGLKLLSRHADDRVVDALSGVVPLWNRKLSTRKRAVVAVQCLGTVGSEHALLQVLAFASSSDLKRVILEAADRVLLEAAQRRGCSLPELYDALAPDLGLAQGITLEVGAQRWRVELWDDLSLRLVSDKGKVSKRLPAPRDAALREQWEAATARLKALDDRLKFIVALQASRLHAAFVSGQRWPLARWRTLFLAHPVLRVFCQSLIWQVADGAPGLRIAEDFALIDAHSAQVELPADGEIGLWHPVSAAAGEVEAWVAHIFDYGLYPLLNQVGAATELPAAEQFKDRHLHPPARITLEQHAFNELLVNWRYRPGPFVDSHSVRRHVLYLPAAQLNVTLHHSDCNPDDGYSRPVEIGYFQIHDTRGEWTELNPADLPRPLLATLMEQMRALAQAARH